jgi:hypothetical protein
MIKKKSVIISTVLFFCICSFLTYDYRREILNIIKFHVSKTPNHIVIKNRLNNFKIEDGNEFKLINSALKQNYEINFSAKINHLDTLYIGKGTDSYLSSALSLTQDSIEVKKVTKKTISTSYKHNLNLKDDISINITRLLDSTFISITSDNDTFSINADFVGMGNPFIRSSGSILTVTKFEFTSMEYESDVFIFGDSYVNCASPSRWPYYIRSKNSKFLCDGLPGGKSQDAYDFALSAISIHKPKYLIWCLGMNDGSDRLGTNKYWKYYLNKIIDLTEKNNIILILATIPNVPGINHTGKNNFIRNSNYKYIDFDRAVSDSNGQWKNGTLANDLIHPTEKGAKILASKFLQDFPEILNNSL